VAIIGKPNVGKSTLLNALLNEEKAIVSEIPGTTRDAIEDTIVIEGYSFRFIDTAGLRLSEDRIEKIGIERTWEKIRDAAVILYIFDATVDSYQDVAEAITEFEPVLSGSGKRLILIANKTDLLSELPHGFKDFVEHETLFVSAKRGENIHMIAESLINTVKSATIADSTIVSNSRHLEALQNSLSAVESVDEALRAGVSGDLVSTDIRRALYHLGEITGEITTDEILGNIFGRFCIGK
jgi:tRNA modification GTPase